MKEPKLTIELVPKSAWFVNLRSVLPSWAWDRARRGCYANAGFRCEICNGVGRKHPVECHEIWDYDDANKLQKLTGLIALCPDCHKVKHIGLAIEQGYEARVMSHLVKVNEWTARDAEEYVFQQFKKHHERSRFAWETDISWINSLFPSPVISL